MLVPEDAAFLAELDRVVAGDVDDGTQAVIAAGLQELKDLPCGACRVHRQCTSLVCLYRFAVLHEGSDFSVHAPLQETLPNTETLVDMEDTLPESCPDEAFGDDDGAYEEGEEEEAAADDCASEDLLCLLFVRDA